MSANDVSDSKQQQASDVKVDIVPESFKSTGVSGVEGKKDGVSAEEITSSALNGKSYLGAFQSAKKGGHG
ncbi:hypothetical protein QVD17_12010 [Tagetes erecta]|uniref:Uncharacterized protein n=1 Tax=Tagetes erecta TaxID=13708 RepID=A0AAD8P2J3_TARER|nr:hypothetical protein QVD17_12010 [Tagetes erecta]